MATVARSLEKDNGSALVERVSELLREAVNGLQDRPDSGELGPVARKIADELQRLREANREPSGEPSRSTSTRFASVASRVAESYFEQQRSRSRFCERVLDDLIGEVGAGSGAILLFGEDSAEADIIAARDGRGQTTSDLRVSRTILDRIRQGEDAILVEDAPASDLRNERSVQELRLRSILATSIRFRDAIVGAVHLEKRSAAAFDEDDRDLLVGVGHLLAVFLEPGRKHGSSLVAHKQLAGEPSGEKHFGEIIGNSPQLLEVLETVRQVAASDATVVIQGETGTGKELIARALHLASPRRDRPMVVVNCAAIPEQLMESELFGHEKGSFTTAYDRRVGKCEEAHGSTLFLDEIGEMAPTQQARLLRFLQDKKLSRVGSNRTIPVDVRVIAATNQNLSERCDEGKFRRDLYWRLAVVPLHVPPLRERPEDIPYLVGHFVREHAKKNNRKPVEVDPDALECLQQYFWPGNVRQLEYLIHRLLLLTKEGRIRLEHLPPHLRPMKPKLNIEKNPFRRLMSTMPATYDELQRRRREMRRIASGYAQALEDRFVDFVLEKYDGNKMKAAEETGMHRTLIHRNLKARRSGEA